MITCISDTITIKKSFLLTQGGLFLMGMMEYVEEWVIDMRVRELSEGSIAVNRTLIQYYLNYSNSKTQGKV